MIPFPFPPPTTRSLAGEELQLRQLPRRRHQRRAPISDPPRAVVGSEAVGGTRRGEGASRPYGGRDSRGSPAFSAVGHQLYRGCAVWLCERYQQV